MQNPDLFGGDMMGIEDPDVRILIIFSASFLKIEIF